MKSFPRIDPHLVAMTPHGLRPSGGSVPDGSVVRAGSLAGAHSAVPSEDCSVHLIRRRILGGWIPCSRRRSDPRIIPHLIRSMVRWTRPPVGGQAARRDGSVAEDHSRAEALSGAVRLPGNGPLVRSARPRAAVAPGRLLLGPAPMPRPPGRGGAGSGIRSGGRGCGQGGRRRVCGGRSKGSAASGACAACAQRPQGRNGRRCPSRPRMRSGVLLSAVVEGVLQLGERALRRMRPLAGCPSGEAVPQRPGLLGVEAVAIALPACACDGVVMRRLRPHVATERLGIRPAQSGHLLGREARCHLASFRLLGAPCAQSHHRMRRMRCPAIACVTFGTCSVCERMHSHSLSQLNHCMRNDRLPHTLPNPPSLPNPSKPPAAPRRTSRAGFRLLHDGQHTSCARQTTYNYGPGLEDQCPDCLHHLTLHDEGGCTLPTCNCTRPTD
jgi:hypothetical protein